MPCLTQRTRSVPTICKTSKERKRTDTSKRKETKEDISPQIYYDDEETDNEDDYDKEE